MWHPMQLPGQLPGQVGVPSVRMNQVCSRRRIGHLEVNGERLESWIGLAQFTWYVVTSCAFAARAESVNVKINEAAQLVG